MEKRKGSRKRELKLCVVVSVYNEVESLAHFHERLRRELGKLSNVAWRIIYVNDGSEDGSRKLLEGYARRSRRVAAVHLAGNFGHEAAMLAGIDATDGEAVVCMDADLQHPPKELGRMVEAYRAGNEIVLMKRKVREGDGDWREWMNGGYYRLYNWLNSKKLEQNVTDFFLVSPWVAGVLRREYREKRRFLRAILQAMGFEQRILEFSAPARRWGRSKYSPMSLLVLSSHSLLSFSPFALYLCLLMSGWFAGLSVLLVVFSVVMFFLKNPVPGYTTLIVFMSSLAAVQFLVMGILAHYLSIVIDEVKRRPVYVVVEEKGIQARDER